MVPFTTANPSLVTVLVTGLMYLMNINCFGCPEVPGGCGQRVLLRGPPTDTEEGLRRRRRWAKGIPLPTPLPLCAFPSLNPLKRGLAAARIAGSEAPRRPRQPQNSTEIIERDNVDFAETLKISTGARERQFFASSRQNWGEPNPTRVERGKREKRRHSGHRPQSVSDAERVRERGGGRRSR